jgi:type VI secretion system protein ImpE
MNLETKMEAKDLIKAGKLSEARSLLIEEVKSSPTNLNSRTLLFQVQAYGGEWEKARRQLEIIASQDANRETGVQVYLNLIQAETERMEVFRNKRIPSFLPKAPPYFEQYQDAWQKLNAQEFEASEAIFNEIRERCANISGTLNSREFNGFSETDTRLACFLEAFVHEHYVWVPMETLRELILSEPQTLLDLLWASAQITLRGGLTLNCYLPVLYPDSFRHEDDRLKLGRMTDWTDLGRGFHQGWGQHVYLVGDGEVGILEIREMVFNTLEVENKDESGN